MRTVADADVLDRALRLFERLARSVLVDNASGGASELDTVLALGISIFQQIQKSERAAASPVGGQAAQNIAAAREIADLYASWYVSAKPLAAAIQSSVPHAGASDNRDEFLTACKYARVPALHFQELSEIESRAARCAADQTLPNRR